MEDLSKLSVDELRRRYLDRKLSEAAFSGAMEARNQPHGPYRDVIYSGGRTGPAISLKKAPTGAKTYGSRVR